MAVRRIRFKPAPGVVAGAMLLWVPTVFLAHGLSALEAEARQAEGPTCEGEACPHEVRAVVESYEQARSGLQQDRVVFRAGETHLQLETEPFQGQPAGFELGQTVQVRTWRGKAVAALGCRGQLQAEEHPAQRARRVRLALLALGALGLGVLLVGGLVGGPLEP